MSHAMSSSAKNLFGIQRGCHAWRMARATVSLTDEENATVFPVIDHCTGECLNKRPPLPSTGFEALQCLIEAIHVANGTRLRHDHRSQFISHVFREDRRTARIESSPNFVRRPEDYGCAERFIRSLREQLRSLHRFRTVAAHRHYRLGEVA